MKGTSTRNPEQRRLTGKLSNFTRFAGEIFFYRPHKSNVPQLFKKLLCQQHTSAQP